MAEVLSEMPLRSRRNAHPMYEKFDGMMTVRLRREMLSRIRSAAQLAGVSMNTLALSAIEKSVIEIETRSKEETDGERT